jgi:hypothetical protein
MALSFAEPLEVTCPHCGQPFSLEIWLIVDGEERPDLARRILDGTLHDARCPSCGQTGQVPAPLLFHDRRTQRVLFGVPQGMDEREWHQTAEDLLWTLIGAIPESARAPYLGGLQAEAGLPGIALVMRDEGLADLPAGADAETPPLVPALQALLAAESPDGLQHVLVRYPLLVEPQTVTILRELAHEAFKQREDEAANGFMRAADILDRVRDLPLAGALREPGQRADTIAPAEDPLDELAFALLRSHSGEALAEVVAQHPQLLDAATDVAVAAWAERARAAGKPRIAEGIAERLAAVRAMRERYLAEQPVYAAVEALINATTYEEIEAVLIERDALYSDAAEAALERLAESGDSEIAGLVGERRDLLRRVRQALEAQDKGAQE